jgi:hypothetical protein
MDAELLYLAGFIDGEGHIAIGVSRSPQGRRRWYLRFACHQVNPAPLLRLQRRFGGSIQVTKRIGNQRSISEWVTVSSIAGMALRELRPYLDVKADEADVAIAFQNLVEDRARKPNPKRRLSPEEEELRESMYRRLRELKHLEYDET